MAALRDERVDCGATWQYLMDLDNWEGNNARWNSLVLRIFDNDIWVSAAAHTIEGDPSMCEGIDASSSNPALERRLYRIDKTKLVPAPMPPLLTRGP